MDDKAMQALYMEAQVMDQQMKVLGEQYQRIEQQIEELSYFIDSLDEMKNNKTGVEMMVPFSTGIFMKAKLDKEDSFFVNVGNGVIVEKNLQETKDLLGSQVANLAEAAKNFESEMQTYVTKFEEIQEKIKNV